MRLIRLKTEPIRVEGKYGVVIISLEEGHMRVRCIPDTLCEIVDQVGNPTLDQTLLRKQP